MALPDVLQRMPDGFEPIVVDNGSSDGSAQVAAAHGSIVIREPQAGFGAACFAGLQAANDEIVCFMDCDCSLNPMDLPKLISPIISGAAELAMGMRQPVPGAFPLHARVANRVLTYEIKRRTGVKLRDLGPMRAAKREDLLSLDIADRRFGWPLEMIMRAISNGWVISEIPVPYYRRRGKSKVTGTLRGTARAVNDMRKVL